MKLSTSKECSLKMNFCFLNEKRLQDCVLREKGIRTENTPEALFFLVSKFGRRSSAIETKTEQFSTFHWLKLILLFLR